MDTQKRRKVPSVTIRFRSKAELEQAKRAAKINGQSLNMFVVFQVCNGVESVLNRTKEPVSA